MKEIARLLRDYIKSVSRLARGFFGIWSELRKIRELIEWGYWNGLSGSMAGTSEKTGAFHVNLTINPLGLVPTEKEKQAAEEEKYEWNQLENEEDRAATALMDYFKQKREGKDVSNHPAMDIRWP